MTEQDKIAAAVDEAIGTSPTAYRLIVEQMQQRNDAAMQRLFAQYKIGTEKVDVINVRLATLVEVLLGDMDDVRRLSYEHAVQAKFAELIAAAEQQAARATLLNGVHLDPRNLPPRG